MKYRLWGPISQQVTGSTEYMTERNRYYFYRKELAKILKQTGFVSFYEDDKIIDMIVNLLTENRSIEKIEGIISTSEILEYGGEISEEESKEIFKIILDCWSAKNTPYNMP